MSDARGRFLWYELMTTDPEAAIAFYGDVVGWGTQPFDGGEQPYTMWTAGEVPIGGVMALPSEAEGVPPHWMAYIGTSDVDATLARAGELGARIAWGPVEVPDVGRMAGIADPQDAHIAVYQPAGEPPPLDEPRPGRFSWHELWTSDPDGAWDFYSELFGWEKSEAMDMGEQGVYQLYRLPGGRDMGGIARLMPQMPVSAWLLYAMVPSAERAAEAIEGGGGQLYNGPMEVPGGDMIAQGADPQGAAFAVHSRAG